MNRRMMYAGLVAMFAAAVVLVLLMSPVSAQVRQPFEWIYAKRLTVVTTAAIGGATTIGGNASVTGNTTVGGTLAVTGATSGAGAAFSGQVSAGTGLVSTGSTSVGTFLVTQQGTTQVLTPDGTLTPVTSYQPISSTAAIGTSSVGSAAAGTRLDIVNVGGQTITFTDTGTLRLSGNIALGTADTLSLVSAGTGQGWYQLATTNN